jgi:hypothetical protein
MIPAGEPGLHALDLDPAEVEARFAWARKRGQPGWLWPEIEPQAWRAALSDILSTTSAMLGEGVVAKRLDGDPAAIGLAAYTSGMGPLLGLWLEQGTLTAATAIEPILALHLRHNRLRMDGLAREGRTIVHALAASGIRPMIVKGMHTAFVYFPEPGTRPCSDIDIVVAPRDMAGAERILAEEHFTIGAPVPRPYRRTCYPASESLLPRSLSFVHAEDPWSVDLHSSLDRFFSSTAVASLQRLAAETPLHSWPPDHEALILPQPLLTLHLATHASHGFISLTTLRLFELASVIRSDLAPGSLEWETLIAAGEAIDGLGFVYPAFAFVERLAPGTIPAGVLARCEAAAPMAVRRLVAQRDLVTAHRVDRWSLGEHFLWCGSWRKRLHQFAADVAPLARRGAGGGTASLGATARRVIRAVVRR